MSQLRLIITDLDGTLLHNDKTISEYTVKVINQLKDKGILIAFSTARSEYAARKYIEIIRPEIVISNGGATVRYKEKLIYTSILSGAKVNEIVRMCMDITKGNGDITVETEKELFWNYKEKPPSDYDNAIFTDYQDFSVPAYKITAEIESEGDAKRIVDTVGNCSMISFSREKWRRFANVEATKSNAIRRILKELQISSNDVIAFGDDYNDVDMIEFCGKGIAVSNAIQEVKQVADDITLSNDEDGVVKYLERYL